jgi:hypothetical protein
MWDWLIAYGTAHYETFWLLAGFREYEFIYKRSISDELNFLGMSGKNEMGEFAQTALKDSIQKTTRHFGHSFPNAATIAGALRMALKAAALKKGVELPDSRTPATKRLKLGLY